jgi:ABC-type nitrate/sulfonate/bicarbonate transport system permease component
MRTLVVEPQILLMDEPFGALDTHTKIDMHEVLLRIWEREQQTVLFVTHDLGEALTLADRIILFSARPGQIKDMFEVDFARPRDAVKVRETPRYAELFQHKNTFFGFVTGVSSGFVAGLILGRSDRLSAIFQPFITAVNSIPRIALAPIIVLAFGIGDTSKIVTSWIVVVFLVFFNTFEGARSIDEGFINVARLLGASEWQITRTVVIPSTMAWVFASLSPAISFALIGVIVGEFIGAERGIGRLIIESEARAEASGMMVAVIVLMLVGVALSAMIWRLQAHLLRWQQHNMVE